MCTEMLGGFGTTAGCLTGVRTKPQLMLVDDVLIVIEGLPDLGEHKPEESRIASLVHEHKHLLGEGDRKGRSEYHRKRSSRAPVENGYVRLSFSYTFHVQPLPNGTCRLKINLLRNGAKDVRQRFDRNGQYKVVSDKQADSLMRESCAMLAHDLDLYLTSVAEQALKQGESPDYWGFPDVPQVRVG